MDTARKPGESPYELLLNNTWRPNVTVTGADSMPALVNAGNTMLPGTTLKLSFRLPPTCDADWEMNIDYSITDFHFFVILSSNPIQRIIRWFDIKEKYESALAIAILKRTISTIQ